MTLPAKPRSIRGIHLRSTLPVLALGVALLLLTAGLMAQTPEPYEEEAASPPTIVPGAEPSVVRQYELTADFRKGKSNGLQRTLAGLSTVDDRREGIFESDPIEVPAPFLVLTATWKTAFEKDIEIRVRGSRDSVAWSEWEVLTVDDHLSTEDPTIYRGGHVEFESGTKTRFIQYAITFNQSAPNAPVTLDALTFVFIDPGRTPQRTIEKILQERGPPASAAAVAKPPVISRTEWGCPDGQSSPDWPFRYTTVTHLIVHHTLGSNTSSDWPGRVREYWLQHKNDPNIGGDIGYNYLIDPDGNIYEGRAGGDNVVGGHFSCANDNTMGIALLGTYTSTLPTQAALNSLTHLLAWKCEQRSLDPFSASYHPGTQLTLDTISGHRDGNSTPNPDACPKSTECPGDTLFAFLPSIRAEVESFMQPSGTGTVRVEATLDGAPWSGPVSYSVSGPPPTNFTGTSTGSHPNLPAGGYTVQYLSGGPGGFVEIVPAASQLLVAGGTISWTLRFGTSCTVGSSSLRLATCPPPPPTLSVTLAANPEAGTAPLNDVDLTATVSGSATGTINYTFYCDRDDSGTNITPNHDAKYDGISTNPKTAANICDYTVPDTYTAKVIVERGPLAAEARRTITVGGSSSPVPEVTTLAATSVTQASATFNATVHPKNSATTFWFEYGTTTSVSQSTTTQTLAAATSASAVSISQGGLSCGQQYFYRIRASNAGGPATPGSILSFNTDSCGGGGSQSVQLVADPSFEAGNNAWWVANPAFYIKGTPTFPNPNTGSKYAFLSNLDGSRGNNLSGGMISPSVTIPADATDADLRFYYSITSDEITSTQIIDKVDVYLVRPGNQLNLITTISNLNENGTSYSLKSTDLSSSFYGDTVQIFFAGSTNGSNPTVFRIDDVTLDVDLPSASAPEVTTDTADQVNASSARLNMTVNPHGADTEVWFDLEAGDSTPNDDTQHISIGAGSQPESVSIPVFGLQCATLYYFQAEASNSEGSDSGSVRSFTTSPCAGSAPNADTDPAENITKTSATLTADVDPNGLSTQAWFAWGGTPSLGQETPHISVGSGTGNVDFSQTLSELTCGTTYYFENHASNPAGQDDGATLEFMTNSCDQPSQNDELLLFSSRQACAGPEPAVLLGWTMPQGADPLVTIRRSDGQYGATVNTAVKGPVHEIDSGLIFGNVYRFTVEAQVDGATVSSNELAVPISSDECRLPVTAGDLPHRPVLWAERAFCENGLAKVRLFWTEATGAQSYSLDRIGAYMPSATYDGITGRSFVDSGLTPGGGALYEVDAHNSSGSVSSWLVSVIVPGTVCSTSGAPGSFSANVENLVCADDEGAATLRWGQSAGAAADYRVFEFSDHLLLELTDNQEDFVNELDHLDRGTVARAVVQAESATAPGKFREAYPVARLVPLDVCGASTAPPSVGNASASYIRTDQALLKVSIVPKGSDTSAFFEWGASTAYSSATPSRAVGNGYGFVSLGQVLAGLSCGTTYHFRAVAINAHGRTDGADQSFTTPACTVPVVSISATDATATEHPITSGAFLIQRTGSTAGSLAVAYAVGGTATVGSDHTLGAGSVTIPAGSASTTLTLLPLDDSLVESPETVVVTLQPQSQYVVGTPGSATVTITSDDKAAAPLDFYTLTPCRVVDTRLSQSPLLSGVVRSFQLAGMCGIPATAGAVAVNITAINPTQAGYLTIFPADQAVPGTTALNFRAGQVRANNAILKLSADGRIAVFPGLAAAGQLDFAVDVNGYFDAENSGPLLTFAPKADEMTGPEPVGLVVADFDGDQRADIAVSIYDHGNGDHLSILRNIGASGQLDFDTPVDIPTGSGPEGLAAGDLNNDGKIDLVAADAASGTVSVLRNFSTQGLIDFRPVPALSIGTPHRVVIADFDGDGRPDLIVTSNSLRRVAVFHHASDPNAIAFDYRRDYGADSYLNDLAVADLDRDTKPDILIPLTDSGLLTIFQNNSSPGNVQAGALPSLAAGAPPIRGIAAGDLNNDLAMDVVIAAIGGVGIFRNSSSPGVFNLPRTDLPTGTNPDAVAIGDLDKDGLLDVVVANPSDHTLTVLHNTSEGSPIALTPLDLSPATGLTPFTLVLEDMDGDGWLDMVVANADGNSVSVILNTSGQQ